MLYLKDYFDIIVFYLKYWSLNTTIKNTKDKYRIKF